MKILLVTGRLAEEMVKKYGEGCDIYVCDVDVAAFITPSHLGNAHLEGYDLVLVPGLTANCDWKSFEMKKGVKIRLGPIHAADIRSVLKFVGKVDFSHKIPACRLVNIASFEEAKKEIEELEKTAKFRLGNIGIGRESRMKVVAEIQSFEKIEEDIEKFSAYADIIDISVPLEYDADSLRKALKKALDLSKPPVSVDTFSKKAIEIAVNEGVDMVMSISSSNVDALDLIEDQAVVVAERDLGKLFQILELARRKTEKVIADPILDPPLKVAESLQRYIDFRKFDKETPLLFGVGNVTELSDADSIGINAVLAFIAEEIGCNLLFTTEASPKTFGCVKELKIASYMAKAAKLRNSPPKDLGISLLALKDKVKYPSKAEKDYLEAKESKEFIRDPSGDFIIFVAEEKIFCKHEKVTVAGKNAKEILDTILALNLVSRLDHAAYLGRELMKAEIALKLGKNYIQDRDLSFGFYDK